MTKITLKKQDMPATGEYRSLLKKIKADIQQTQLRATMAVTKELVMLYWRIGKHLAKKLRIEEKGARVAEQLARDLKIEFPDMTGFSLRNLRYMKQFAETYPSENVAAAAATIPWGHIMVLIDKLESKDQGILH